MEGKWAVAGRAVDKKKTGGCMQKRIYAKRCSSVLCVGRYKEHTMPGRRISTTPETTAVVSRRKKFDLIENMFTLQITTPSTSSSISDRIKARERTNYFCPRIGQSHLQHARE